MSNKSTRPKVNTKPPSSVYDNHSQHTIEVVWPGVFKDGMPVGCILQFSEIEDNAGRKRAMIDIYRHDNAVLVRADSHVLQDQEMPLGVTLHHTLTTERHRIFKREREVLDLQEHLDKLEAAVTEVILAFEDKDLNKLKRKVAELEAAMAGSSKRK